MPDEDGFSLIGRIRRLTDEQGGNTPAIALTAYARAEDRVRALRSGFQMHVAKPVEPAELIVVVANLAGRMRNPERIKTLRLKFRCQFIFQSVKGNLRHKNILKSV